MLFYGPPGTGKTSTIKAFGRELYGDYFDLMVLEINASEERGIDIVRSKIKDFVITKPNFYDEKIELFKLVILDEGDAMTNEAQAMLRKVIESHTSNARFCIICNYKSKIIEAIQSRCTLFKFPPLNIPSMTKKIKEVAKDNNIKISKDSINMLIKISKGDMRMLLNKFQSIGMLGEEITPKFIRECLGYPGEDDIDKIMDYLFGNKLSDNINNVKKYINKHCFSLNSVIGEIANKIEEKVLDGEMNLKTSLSIINGLKEIEINLCSSPDSEIQISTLAGYFYMALRN
jgi:replication factor C subunit 3/5